MSKNGSVPGRRLWLAPVIILSGVAVLAVAGYLRQRKLTRRELAGSLWPWPKVADDTYDPKAEVFAEP
jgi:hypothetical protein